MYVMQYTIKNNYLMSDEELRTWQTNTMISCQLENILNTAFEGTRQFANVFESAVNTAISIYGLQQSVPRMIEEPISSPANYQGQAFQSATDEARYFDDQAISAAIELQGIGIPPNR